MSSIFMSHTSIDKPFVEKLTRDLKKYGINNWYDKYEIKVGESIFWKIDEGISTSDYLGIVISKEAWESEWVKKEVAAAFSKQINMKRNILLPIFYRDCDIPLILQAIKYADFRSDYDIGLKDLLNVFGIKNIDVLTEDNWRKFVKISRQWKEFRDEEFEKIVTMICKITENHNWSVWVGGQKNPYSICLSMYNEGYGTKAFSIRMVPEKGYRYLVAETTAINPNHIPLKTYNKDIGYRLNEVEEYIWDRIEQLTKLYGKSTKKRIEATERYSTFEQKTLMIKDMLKKLNWNQDI